jgi:hypothetical protein
MAKFEAEIRRIDQLSAAESRRVDGILRERELAVNAALVSQEKAIQAALAASEKAVSKAETATEKRFESVNEFRGQLADQTAGFLSRVEYLADQRAMNEKLDAIKGFQGNQVGASSAITNGWKYILSVGSLIIGIVGIYIATHP